MRTRMLSALVCAAMAVTGMAAARVPLDDRIVVSSSDDAHRDFGGVMDVDGPWLVAAPRRDAQSFLRVVDVHRLVDGGSGHVATIPAPPEASSFARDVAVDGDLLAVGAREAVYLYDLTEPAAAPTRIGRTSGQQSQFGFEVEFEDGLLLTTSITNQPRPVTGQVHAIRVEADRSVGWRTVLQPVKPQISNTRFGYQFDLHDGVIAVASGRQGSASSGTTPTVDLIRLGPDGQVVAQAATVMTEDINTNITDLAVADGRLALSMTRSGGPTTVSVHDIVEGAVERQGAVVEQPVGRSEGWGRSMDLDDGLLLVSSVESGRVLLVDLDEGSARVELAGSTEADRFGGRVLVDGRRVAIGAGDNGGPDGVVELLQVVDPDVDDDGVPNEQDNCPAADNADQADVDGDGVGDVCDEDVDGDGVANGADSCERTSNADQADADGDGVGDACDADVDGDGVANGGDNCERSPNAGQADLDGDGVGDVCDGDVDGDGVANGADNCRDDANAEQADLDGDGVGDVCDEDVDGDGVANGADSCERTSNADQADADGDGVGDVCDGDVDGDGVANGGDNCRDDANAEQADLDGDGAGDACDEDVDGDGAANRDDNCPRTSNGDQSDVDADGLGDVCDRDVDGDGLANADDNCPTTSNPEQGDRDDDGRGDACDADVDGDGVDDADDNCPEVQNAEQGDGDRDGVGDACDDTFDPLPVPLPEPVQSVLEEVGGSLP